jgi:hypothetical protein
MNLYENRGNIMNKKITICLFILVVLILFILYIGDRNKITYSSPTQEQVNGFISKNRINALTVKETDDFCIVLFENNAKYGHYVLYQDQNNKLFDVCVKANNNSLEYLVSLGGVASGKIPFVTVIINNEDMLKKAKEIEVTFADGGVVCEGIDGKGIIVLYKNEKNVKPMTYIKLVIYDKDKNILYEV